jgi:hypothetical protein
MVAAYCLVAQLLAASELDKSPLPDFGRFTDVTQQAGIHFVQTSGGPDKQYILETVGGGVALFDYDLDGWLDLYLVNGSDFSRLESASASDDRLYRNRRDETFEDVTTKAGISTPIWGMGAAIADYDNDGYPDIFVTGYQKTILYRNKRDGTFQNVTAQAGLHVAGWSTGADWADYDRDGDLDLYVARYVDFHKSEITAKGSSAFCQYRGLPVMCGPRGLRAFPDVLFKNNGDGTFADVTAKALGPDVPAYYGFTPVWADFNDDGWPDLYVANDGTPSLLYRNRGDGTFVEEGAMAGCAFSADGREQAGMGADAGDFDGDGNLDVVKTNFSDDSNNIYRNLGRNEFEDVSLQTGITAASWPHLGWAAKFVDFNRDGRLDLFVSNGHVYPEVDEWRLDSGYLQPTQVFINAQNKFVDVSASVGLGVAYQRLGRGAAFGDIDNDGDIDVVMNHLDSAAAVLVYQAPAANWVAFQLEGTRSNRDAIGARICIRSGGRQQVRDVSRGGGFLSSNDQRVYFGTGVDDVIDKVEIRWPSGIKQVLNSVQTGRTYRIVER